MRASAGANRPSLLAAFGSLDEDTRADFLEAAEMMAARLTPGPGLDSERDELRRIIRRVYAAAGWENRP